MYIYIYTKYHNIYILYIHTSYIDDTVHKTNHLKRDVSFSTDRPGEPVRAPDNSAAVKSCHQLLVPAEMRPAETVRFSGVSCFFHGENHGKTFGIFGRVFFFMVKFEVDFEKRIVINVKPGFC